MKKYSLPFLPVIAVLLISLLGDVGFDWGARAFRPLPWVKIVANLVGHAGFVVLFVLGPLTQIIYPKLDKRSEFARMGVACVYTLIPLLAYAFFLSQVQDFAALQEMFVSTVPIVVAALILYEKDRAFVPFAVLVGAGTFIPYYLFNDILGPFPVLVQFVPDTVHVGLFRALAAWGPVILATLWSEPKNAFQRQRYFASGCLEIFAFAVLVHLVAPFLALLTHSAIPAKPFQNSLWVSYVLIAFLLFRQYERSYWFLCLLSGTLGVISLVLLTKLILDPSDAVWSVLGAQYELISAFVMLRLSAFLFFVQLKSNRPAIKIIKPHTL